MTREGNLQARQLMADVFERRESFEWRGLGELPRSALRIREKYADFDADVHWTPAGNALYAEELERFLEPSLPAAP